MMIWKKPVAWCPECSEHVNFCFSKGETKCLTCFYADKPRAFKVPKEVEQECGFFGLFVRLWRWKEIRRSKRMIAMVVQA